jgi:hypothetical protein
VIVNPEQPSPVRQLVDDVLTEQADSAESAYLAWPPNTLYAKRYATWLDTTRELTDNLSVAVTYIAEILTQRNVGYSTLDTALSEVVYMKGHSGALDELRRQKEQAVVKFVKYLGSTANERDQIRVSPLPVVDVPNYEPGTDETTESPPQSVNTVLP